jgi:tetratricopeptide (TPR) repeat protein
MEAEAENAALQLYARAIQRFPDSAINWVSYGHVLRSKGKQDDAVAAYRMAINKRPAFGEAWYAIADLKTGRFSPDDAEQLRRLVDQQSLPSEDRVQLEFALARALEQFGTAEEAFLHYDRANRIRRSTASYDAAAIRRHVDASIQLLDETFFRQRAGAGEASPDPIFILGMPRAGSTLLEQILSSHSQVEATGELPDIPNLANMLANGRTAAFEDSSYLRALSETSSAHLRQLGQSYIWTTGLRRRTMKPYFIDKMPNNWLHLGLVMAILPNAKIIDARRHPLACGFSNYCQYFAQGQEFSYDLANIGAFYRDYVRLMRHVDQVQPGRVYRVVHERLVENAEDEIRTLLDQLGLPFDERCLRFYENKRSVKTASSEQVRRPINREGLEQWKRFDAWLEPLRVALGDVSQTYPA